MVSRSVAIRLTWDFDNESMPNCLTSLIEGCPDADLSTKPKDALEYEVYLRTLVRTLDEWREVVTGED